MEKIPEEIFVGYKALAESLDRKIEMLALIELLVEKGIFQKSEVDQAILAKKASIAKNPDALSKIAEELLRQP